MLFICSPAHGILCSVLCLLIWIEFGIPSPETQYVTIILYYYGLAYVSLVVPYGNITTKLFTKASQQNLCHNAEYESACTVDMKEVRG